VYLERVDEILQRRNPKGFYKIKLPQNPCYDWFAVFGMLKMSVIRGKKPVTHVVGTGDNKFLTRCSDVYGSIDTVVGVTKLTGDPPSGAKFFDLKNALRNGLAAKVRITYKDGTKNKTTDLIVAVDKLDTAIGQLPSKNFDSTKEIVSARFPVRRILR
jgi:hypothetical protein